MKQQKLYTVVCADVGSVIRGRFAWWSDGGEHGHDLDSLVDHVVDLMNHSRKVALGFECPLSIPLRERQTELLKARSGESNRSWSAGAGATVTAVGLVQVPWVLEKIRSNLKSDFKPQAYLDWPKFCLVDEGLFLWEAFVSVGGKKDQEFDRCKSCSDQGKHVEDAITGARAFSECDKIQKIDPCHSLVSLVGAALLRTGWSNDIGFLSAPCLIVSSID
jgi:hypothetical protein